MSGSPAKGANFTDTKVMGATGGAVGLGALGAALGTCCVAPWTVGVVGVAGAVALARLVVLEPVLLAGALLLLGVALYFAYRPLPVCEDGSCDRTSQRRLRWIVWIGAAVVAVLLAVTFIPYL